MKLEEREMPVVSIGMIVYNDKDTVSEAIETILNQNFGSFELIISDNASTDGTEDLCREYARNDSRIIYIRQSTNIGSDKNIVFVFEQARCEFFMWAPAHYSRSEDFLGECVEKLQGDLNYNIVSTPNCWVGDEDDPDKSFNFSIEGTVYERLCKYLDVFMDSHACFYGVYRRSSIDDVVDLADPYIANDTAFFVKQLLKGGFGRTDDGILIVGRGQSAHPDYIATFQTRLPHYLLPLYDFSKRVSFLIAHNGEMTSREKLIIYVKILIINARVYNMIVRYWVRKGLRKRRWIQ